MKIYKVLPDLSKKRQMHLWHTALRSQWSAEELDWSKPVGLGRNGMRDQLAKVMTPVLIGEQSALYSVSGLIPVLGSRSEVESQFYLTTWAVDEARHTELFARMFRRIDREPMSIRRLPEGYLFQSAIASSEPAEWLSGVLVSEVMATKIMEEFRRLDLDPVLSDIADGILDDEARHLGFNHIYLEDRFASLYRKDAGNGGDAAGGGTAGRNAVAGTAGAAGTAGEGGGSGSADGAGEGDALLARLHRRIDLVVARLPPVFERLSREFDDVGVERDRLLFEVEREVHRRLDRSARAGLRVATLEAEGRPPTVLPSVRGPSGPLPPKAARSTRRPSGRRP